jgi:predicted O-linked N-acetylglucosamine transferase (SPINDLY family)
MWHPDAYQALIAEDYPQVAAIYEELIDNDPENVSHYWYLGVAYLLQNLQAEAQVMWQSILREGNPEQVQQWQGELEAVLDTEARRQQEKGNLAAVEYFRYHLQEIVPRSINNLLALFDLSLDLGIFDPEELLNYPIIYNLRYNPNRELLIKVILKSLLYPHELTLNLAQESLPYLQELADSFIPQAFQVAIRVTNEQQSPAFGVEIIKLCLQLRPDDLSLLEQLVNLYILAEDFDNSLKTAYQLQEICATPSLKLYSNYLILSILLRWGVWQEIPNIYQEYQNLLQELIKQKNITLEPIIKTSFLNVSSPLPYLGDRALANRQLTNRIAEIFLDNNSNKNPFIFTKKEAKKLTIGYLASTFRHHSVAWLSRWLIHHHDREKFQIAIYTINQEEDEITRQWFRDSRDIIRHFPYAQNPREVAQQIHQDQVDILVELDSLTHNLTNQIMALKPAPKQITWLGWDASGLATIDYYIADPYVLPDKAEEYYRKKIYRLPETYLAIDGFEIGVPNLRREDLAIPDDAIIYFSVQSGMKRHPDTIRLQMKILAQVPNSYFLIKGIGNVEKIQQLFTDIAVSEGVNPERLRFLPRDIDEYTHRANLQIADIVLDTYPYNGATTTLEVLWQGIPLVTLVGEQFSARNSYTFMLNAGIEAGIGWNEAEYIDWGIKLGLDRSLRQEISNQLLGNRDTAPLWQGKKFAQQMENAYLEIWARS